MEYSNLPIITDCVGKCYTANIRISLVVIRQESSLTLSGRHYLVGIVMLEYLVLLSSKKAQYC